MQHQPILTFYSATTYQRTKRVYFGVFIFRGRPSEKPITAIENTVKITALIFFAHLIPFAI